MGNQDYFSLDRDDSLKAYERQRTFLTLTEHIIEDNLQVDTDNEEDAEIVEDADRQEVGIHEGRH